MAYKATALCPMTSSDIIRLLDLKPHPEGGHYCETLRDPMTYGSRPVSTAIYFLLAAEALLN
jgi:uncharacterized protein